MAIKNVEGAMTSAKKVRRSSAKAKTKEKRTLRKIERPWDPSQIKLPTEKQEPILDMREYAFLLYGREGVGKTTALASFPGLLLVTAEAGAKGLPVYVWNGDRGGTSTWPIFIAMIDAIERDPGQFKNVGIDTIDRLYQHCQDYMCDEVLHIPGPGQDADGAPDRGVSYKMINREFTDALDRILRTGLGLWMTSHVKEIPVRKRTGGEYDRMTPSLSDSPRRIVEAYVDFIWFADYAKDMNGRDKRVILTHGDELITAKSRKVGDRKMPKYLPMLEDGWYDMVKETFEGDRSHRLDPTTLLPSRKGTKAGGAVLREDRAKAQLHTRRKGGRRA